MESLFVRTGFLVFIPEAHRASSSYNQMSLFLWNPNLKRLGFFVLFTIYRSLRSGGKTQFSAMAVGVVAFFRKSSSFI